MASALLMFSGATAATLTFAALAWRARAHARTLSLELRHAREHLAGTEARLRSLSAVAHPLVALPAADDWLALPSRSALDALWDWDVVADRIRLSARWRELVGRPAEEILGSTEEWWGRVHPSDRSQCQVDIAAQLAGREIRFSSEHRVRHENGSWLRLHWAGAILRDTDGRAVRVTGSARDTTTQRTAEERQRRESLYDAQTGLPNRALAIDLLRRAINRARRQGERLFAVLYVDVDRFNLLNDALGHQAGDELLRGVAQRLAMAIRPGDVIARLGGDEFLLLLDDIADIAEAETVATRVKSVLTEPIEVISHPVVVSVSIGIVLHDPTVQEPTDYLRDAELAMHGAKRAGRARHERFATSMREGAQRRMSIELDFRGAIEREEFVLLYQPVWDMRGTTERLMGFEALARWNHPSRGMLGPAEFVPIAEETDMIVHFGLWAITRACRDLRALVANGERTPWVSVNVAARQLADPRLAAAITDVLDYIDLDASRLKLEVTENVVLRDEETARRVLETLRLLGVRSMMDDFGTGHASLSYLHRLPISTIKIDRYFVGRMDVSPECLEIVRSVIALARSLGMEVVAEGVEQEEQLAQLRELGCHAAQGFLLARPMTIEEAHALVASLEQLGAECPRHALRALGVAGGHRHSMTTPTAASAAPIDRATRPTA